jgi:hypothetical protein
MVEFVGTAGSEYGRVLVLEAGGDVDGKDEGDGR